MSAADGLEQARGNLLNQYRSNTTAFVASIAGIGVILFTEFQALNPDLSNGYAYSWLVIIIYGVTSGGIFHSIWRAYFWAQFSRVALSESLAGLDGLFSPPDTVPRVHAYFQCVLNRSSRRLITNGESGLILVGSGLSISFWDYFLGKAVAGYCVLLAGGILVGLFGLGMWLNTLRTKRLLSQPH